MIGETDHQIVANLIAFLALLVSGIALYCAVRASDESKKLTSQSNRLANEANRIANEAKDDARKALGLSLNEHAVNHIPSLRGWWVVDLLLSEGYRPVFYLENNANRLQITKISQFELVEKAPMAKIDLPRIMPINQTLMIPFDTQTEYFKSIHIHIWSRDRIDEQPDRYVNYLRAIFNSEVLRIEFVDLSVDIKYVATLQYDPDAKIYLGKSRELLSS